MKTVAVLETLQPVVGAENIPHLHWINAVFQDPAVRFAAVAEHF